MSRRIVTRIGRDSEGRVVALGNASGSWSPRDLRLVVGDIRSGLHQYATRAHDSEAHVFAISGGVLRSAPDGQTRNNLDALPPLAPTGIAGGFDVTLDLSWQSALALLAVAHAGGAMRTGYVAAVGGSLVEAHAGPPRVTLVDGSESDGHAASPLLVDVGHKFHLWVRENTAPLELGRFANFEITRRFVIKRPKRVARLRDYLTIQMARRGALKVQRVWGSEPENVIDAEIARALLGRSRKLEWSAPKPTSLSGLSALDLRAAIHRAGTRLQIGMCLDKMPWAGFPTTRSGDWVLGLSSSYVARRVLTSLSDAFGGVPPPLGSRRIHIGELDAWLESLDVQLKDDGLDVTGIVSSDGRSAKFVVEFGLGIDTGGAVVLSLLKTNVDVDLGTWDAVANFFTGGRIRRAVENAILAAVQSLGQGHDSTPGLLSVPLVRELSRYSGGNPIGLDVQASGLVATEQGLLVDGILRLSSTARPYAHVIAMPQNDRGEVVLSAFRSWVPGDEIAAIDWEFPNGTQASSSGRSLCLAASFAPPLGRSHVRVRLTSLQGQVTEALVEVNA